MIIPFFNPARRNVTFSLLLVLALLLLILTGLGVFRLYFNFEGADPESSAGQLFSLKIRGGNSFNLFEAAPFGAVFWASQAIILALAILLPWFRMWGGSLLAVCAAVAVFLLHYYHGSALPRVPLAFEFLTILVLYMLYVLLSYIAEIRDRKRFAALLSQYVPPELANEYSRNPATMGLGGEEREITVLFCDVVGFTAISEQLESKQMADWLNGFFAVASKVIVRHRGTIDKYMGDSVMAVWGAPAPSTTHAFDALSAAMDIQLEIAELQQSYIDKGWPAISVGVGVSTGLANVGPMGSKYRMDYTVIGDAVNVAQRLEEQTRKYHVPVIVSDKTAIALPDMLFRELDTISVKGRKSAVNMYQPLLTNDPAGNFDSEFDEREIKQFLRMHEEAMIASKDEDWTNARRLFIKLRDEWGPAEMYDLYLRGIDQAALAKRR